MSDKLITAYKIYKTKDIKILAAPKERTWMENTDQKYAYRCLPLNIANQHGWCVYLDDDVEVVWNGENNIDAISVTSRTSMASSHFGHGVLTFHINHVIKTSPGYNLYISGPPNHFINGIQPMTGIYESDWAPYSFTMNWQITVPNKVIKFSKDDPICFFFPIERNMIEQFEFEITDITKDKELYEQFRVFNILRHNFTKYPNDAEWQKNYFQGKMPEGGRCPIHDHKTKLKLNEPKDKKVVWIFRFKNTTKSCIIAANTEFEARQLVSENYPDRIIESVVIFKEYDL